MGFFGEMTKKGRIFLRRILQFIHTPVIAVCYNHNNKRTNNEEAQFFMMIEKSGTIRLKDIHIPQGVRRNSRSWPRAWCG